MKQSGDFAWIYSEPGQGTTFKIYLPRTDQAGGPVTAGRATHSLHGTETVLLVEDDESVRALVQRVLLRHGYTVMAAGSGEEAIDLATEHRGPLHLVITDMVMPGMSGRELVERVTELHPAFKAIYMSGYTDDEIIRRGLLDEQTAFLQKPFTAELLARKVREVLDLAPAGDREDLAALG